MFKETDRQGDLLSISNQLAEGARRRLKQTWADGFARKVMPILLEAESDFAAIYDDETGRPAYSVARKLGVCILQHMFDLDDQTALNRLQFDVRWQYALGVEPGEAYLSRRSYVKFRSKLVAFDPEMKRVRKLFDRITDRAIDDLDIEADTQRVDSTLITSNIQTKGRRWLFAETLLKFMGQLTEARPEVVDELEAELVEWVDKRQSADGWFGSGQERTQTDRPDIAQLARWVAMLVDRFWTDETVMEWESFHRLVRLFSEHCHIEPADQDDAPEVGTSSSGGVAVDEESVRLRDAARNSGASMQSPHDPDAGYGHKGTGYTVHVSETCDPGDGPRMLTAWEVDSANHNDWGKSTDIYERLAPSGRQPEVMYADAGYPTAGSLVDARSRGSRLHAPVTQGNLPDEHVGREAFEWADEGRIEACPAGNAPADHRQRDSLAYDEPSMHAVFEGVCQDCPLQSRCPATYSHGQSWYVDLDERLIARDEALADQTDDEWWDDYSIRSGVEATVSELARAHGMDALRVRGRPKVEWSVAFKMIGCNAKRWLDALEPSDDRRCGHEEVLFGRSNLPEQPASRPEPTSRSYPRVGTTSHAMAQSGPLTTFGAYSMV